MDGLRRLEAALQAHLNSAKVVEQVSHSAESSAVRVERPKWTTFTPFDLKLHIRIKSMLDVHHGGDGSLYEAPFVADHGYLEN